MGHDEVVERIETRMPADQFERLLAALDRPAQVIPAVARQAARERAAVRR